MNSLTDMIGDLPFWVSETDNPPNTHALECWHGRPGNVDRCSLLSLSLAKYHSEHGACAQKAVFVTWLGS